MDKRTPGKAWTKLLKDKSTRVVVTMGMPAFYYRWYFRAYSLKSLEPNILAWAASAPSGPASAAWSRAAGRLGALKVWE